MKIEVTKDGYKAVLARIKGLTKSEVLVGIPDANAPRSNDEDEDRKASGGPLNNAEIGYVHEYGVPEKNIPARPFLLPGVRGAKERVAKVLAAGVNKTLKGDAEAASVALTKAGLIAETSVKSRIDEGPFAALSDVTLAQRRRRGRSGEKPLIDTAQMQRAVTHVVRPKGEK